MGAMKTPGVYIVEKNAFPNSVVEVATAVPAFIGYTEKALNGNKSLLKTPWRITSMAEFHSYFGGAPTPKFRISVSAGEPVVTCERKHTLYYHMLFFYANGGGPCYIVSVGNYDEDPDASGFTAGIETLLKEQEPTMVVIPEAVNLDADNCQKVQEAMLKHCGYDMKNRFAIFDVFNGDKGRKDPEAGDVILDFRERIGSNYLNFGAAYYPWMNTSILQESDVDLSNITEDTLDVLRKLLVDQIEKQLGASADEDEQAKIDARKAEYNSWFEQIIQEDADKMILHKTLLVISPLYKEIMKELLLQINCLPVSAAMAGVYTMVDNTRGVWKAPANVSVANAVSPTVNLTHGDQEELNVPLSGKAINAIRTFIGEGIKVWGARTLDGNSLDWRYINVRRTMIMLEESIKNAARAYV
ncbi:MAG: phage tail sheath subtilisin-like domain-containing protein, partial [Dysgonamonadaceae bacterium]|nr:phage tail sheath subtilisin-like domain-containing protein [Dysgonamonadaceae bacterium]